MVNKARLLAQKKKPGEVPLPGLTVTVKERVYSLGEPNRYLKATMLLELNSESKSDRQSQAFLEEIRRRDHQIREIISREVKTKTFREVNSPQGKEMLKDELKLKINSSLSRGELKRIMFTSFSVQ